MVASLGLFDALATDASLVYAMAQGDRLALAELYDRYASLLLGVGVQRLGDRRDAEEILHDVFLEAWRASGDYDENRGSVRAWLVMRMHSRALDRRRSPAHRREVPLEEGQARRIAVDADASVQVERARVQAALATLPPEQRTVVELGFCSGLSSTEIAARERIPVGTVKSRTAAALGKLRLELLGGGK